MSTNLFSTPECSWINNVDSSSISDQLLPLCWKNGIQRKKFTIRVEDSSHESAGQQLFMQRFCATVWLWKITNFQDNDFTAMSIHVHTFKVLFHHFKFVVCA